MKSFIKKLPMVLVAIVFAIGLILFIGAYSDRSAFSQISLFGGSETTIKSESIDTDNDGLKDWEEELYKTDPLNPDTDADGYLDGEEINSGHNPLIKSPGDKQVFYPLPLGDKYNITNKIYSDIETVFKSYIEQKDQYARDHPEINSAEEYLAQVSSNTLNEMIKRSVLYNEGNWLEKAEVVLQELPEIFNIEISDNDINISEDNTEVEIDIYKKSLFSYLDSPDFFLRDENFILLRDSLFQGNFSKLNQIIISNDYEIGRLRELTVPSSLKEIHKKILKISITLRNIFVSVRGYESDPVKMIVGLNEVENVLNEWELIEQELE
ncbi:thrombospondin type 3 repeat-containing protein [Patescibacteria group bacterium]|nr:thrombospondin type 3 repeat-containing protein [Patescibacteria group bacterium]MBU3923160.1 thrombospondin type 3 repeat-containing protein [Patescibacteria group bacterium]